LRAEPGRNVIASNCSFTNCNQVALVYGGSTVTLNDCNATVRGAYGAVSVGSFIMNGGSMQAATLAGFWFARGSARLNDVEVSGSGEGAAASLFCGGIRNTFASVTMNCVRSWFNTGPGISSLGGFVYLAPTGGYPQDGRNTITGNVPPEGMIGTQIYFQNTQFALCNGRNKICPNASGERAIEDATPTWHDVSNNYWCGDHAYPAAYTNQGDDTYSGDLRCGLNTGICTPSTPAAYAFGMAWDQENTMLFADAIMSYKYVVETYPMSKEAELCPDRIVFCEKFTNRDWTTRRTYFQSIADTTTDEELEYECRASVAWCDVELGNSTRAQDEFLSLLDESNDNYKYQKTSLLALMAELQSPPWEGVMAPGGARQDHAQHVLDRMEEMLASVHGTAPTSGMPTRYALHQNYPNPFNPVTEIRFDLPEAVHVQLRVFNTLGQVVATLVSEPRAAGSYRIEWDGSQMASGLYIYQLTAGSFTGTRKMILLR
jgi:hypothetical protein